MWFKNMCNLITWPWPRLLLRLPLGVRLGLCILCFPLCASIYLLTFPAFHTGALLTLPMGLASWIFHKRGACICFFGYIAVQLTYNVAVFGSEVWPIGSIIAFAGVVPVLFLEGAILVSLRELLDTEEAARVKADKGEKQTLLAYEQQRQLNQLKNQFIINVNHELRTPLTATYGYLEMLQLLLDENGSLERTTHASYLSIALKHCEDLRALVNNVLDALEIDDEGKSLKVEQIVVANVVQSVIEQVTAFREQAHRTHLDIPRHIRVQANIPCLRHVFHNLLSNAFKYSPDNTPVIIRARYEAAASPLEGGRAQVCISVQDAGPGIPPAEIPLLFEQFMRLKRDLGSPIRGTGLGLYTSKRLIQAMGGQIWVESMGIEGLGSCFYFVLPASLEEPPSNITTGTLKAATQTIKEAEGA